VLPRIVLCRAVGLQFGLQTTFAMRELLMGNRPVFGNAIVHVEGVAKKHSAFFALSSSANCHTVLTKWS
jgi:hypothetical protein